MSEDKNPLPIQFAEPEKSTPSSMWKMAGEKDPHGTFYDRERANLTMGNLTDDELANGAFLNYNMPLDVQGILNGTSHSPIAWMTAVKDRIRWLSRSLEKAISEKTAAGVVGGEEISNDQLISALSECRDVFHPPEVGAVGEREWNAAMADPLSVPSYLRARVLEMHEKIAEYERRLAQQSDKEN